MPYYCPLCFIIPNDIFREIAKNAEEEADKNIALRVISRNSRIRERRSLLSSKEVYTAVPPQKEDGKRVVYTAKNKSDLPGFLIRSEGDKKIKDPSGNEVYQSTGIVHDFCSKVLKRNSFDDEGGNLISTVHYQKKYSNAFWDGTQMVYGDGDGKYFNSFTDDLEITGHELFHGVIAATSALKYSGESGALNESFADVFGCMIKQWQLNQSVEEADWIIGKGLFTDLVKGVGVRKLDEPGKAFNDPVIGKDNTRGSYKTRYKGTGDNGGVHINSGIPSLAFVTACNILGGYSWEQIGIVWYKTLTTQLKPNSNFKDAAKATIKIAKSEFPDVEVASAIQKGWEKVGVI